MPKFEKKYVHFMWSDELKGKKCFIADSIGQLKSRVEQQDEGYIDTIIGENSQDYPFYTKEGDFFALAYYDPNYSLKIAHEQGKKIECKRKDDAWEDLDYTPATALPEDLKYRIKPEEDNPVTRRDLARWLAQGNGEYTEKGLRDTSINCYANFDYPSLFQDDPIPDSFLIRKWDDDEWHSPTREYMGLNTQEV